MIITLERNPLRTSLSMTSGHDVSAPQVSEGPSQPFAYRFASWEMAVGPVDQDQGHYDPDQQVWVTDGGVITNGVATYTRTCGCGDQVIDDACF